MAYHDYVVQDILDKIQKNLRRIEQILTRTARADWGLRPCEVGGAEGFLFHRFVEEDKVLVTVEIMMRPKDAATLAENVKDDLVAPPGTRAEKLTEIKALVEAPNGQLLRVNPQLVRFTDREGAEE